MSRGVDVLAVIHRDERGARQRWRIENETTVRTTDCPNVAERYRVRGYLVTEIKDDENE